MLLYIITSPQYQKKLIQFDYCHVIIQIICVSITQKMSFSKTIQFQIKYWFKLPYLFILLWCIVLSSSFSWNHQSDIVEEEDHVCFRMPLNVSTPCLPSCSVWFPVGMLHCIHLIASYQQVHDAICLITKNACHLFTAVSSRIPH